MYYDEDAQKKRDRMSQVLGHPGHRLRALGPQPKLPAEDGHHDAWATCAAAPSRNCLASKNFGETSLIEIREMLASKGLRLGQLGPEKRHASRCSSPSRSRADEQALLARPIADLSLSVRARKCMIRLGITTIGELLRRTGDELLECKNFGVTSLNEVRDKLAVHGLKLRGD